MWYKNSQGHLFKVIEVLDNDDDDNDDDTINNNNNDDCLNFMSTQQFVSYTRTDSLCCFCQRLMTNLYRGENYSKERLSSRCLGELNPGPLHRSPAC